MKFPGCIWTMQHYERARHFATQKHEEQKYGEREYTSHLRDVALIVHQPLTQMDCFWALHVAAMLHDTIEDTPTTKDEIAAAFGGDMADVINAVSGFGRNRAERFDNICKKIKALGDLAEFAICIKVADRIANTENCYETKNPLIFMYHGEYRDFRRLLTNIVNTHDAHPLTLSLWKRLDNLMEKPHVPRS